MSVCVCLSVWLCQKGGQEDDGDDDEGDHDDADNADEEEDEMTI